VEGAIVARTVGPSALLAGSGTRTAANRSVLWAAHDAALLHVAGGYASLGRSPALPLTDGTVTPLEMIQHGLAPRIAVLSSSRSATATDEEGWGSVASALLESGTEMVIATDRNVEDQASLALMTAFYAQPDWAIHPAHALARAQLALDAAHGDSNGQVREARAWAAFGALGRPPFVPR
jgi:CHAT domain-containing protein